MKTRNTTPSSKHFEEEMQGTKDNFIKVIEQSLNKWFDNEEYLSHKDIAYDDGYELTIHTKAGGCYTVRVIK